MNERKDETESDQVGNKSGLPDKVKVVHFDYASLDFRVSMVGRLLGALDPPPPSSNLGF